MRNIALDTVKISLESKAEAFISWEDTSTTNISPTLYEKYILPEINSWCELIHKAGKYYIQHACGHLKGLMPLIVSSKIDTLESISPPPTGDIELWDAKKLLGERISIIGGIEPTMFLNLTEEELKLYAHNLIDKMPKRGFVVANSDSCPPGVTIEKLKLVGEIVKSIKFV